MTKTPRTHEQTMARIDFNGFLMFTLMSAITGGMFGISGLMYILSGDPSGWILASVGLAGLIAFVVCLVRAVHWWKLSRPTPPDPHEEHLEEWRRASRDRRLHQAEMSLEWVQQFDQLNRAAGGTREKTGGPYLLRTRVDPDGELTRYYALNQPTKDFVDGWTRWQSRPEESN